MWKVTELQEGWDALLEPSYYFTHQGRGWQSPQIHRVRIFFFLVISLIFELSSYDCFNNNIIIIISWGDGWGPKIGPSLLVSVANYIG